MSESTSHPFIPEGLIYADSNALEHKIADFIGAGAANLHIIFDFDRTLTVRKPEIADDITTWNILRNHLPDEGQIEYGSLYEKYRALEIAETMTDTDATEWWTSILGLFVKYKVNMHSVEEDFLDRASIRPGTTELFMACREHNIPTVIMSAGVRDVIDVWSRAFHIEPTLILSTALKLNESGIVIGWDEDTLIHALNKHEAGHPELTNIRNQRRKSIIVGDGMGDADMAAGDADVLRIRVYDPRTDEAASINQVRARTFERFDAMIESGDFSPLLELVRLVVGK